MGLDVRRSDRFQPRGGCFRELGVHARKGGPPSAVAVIRTSAALIENGMPPEETLFGMVGNAPLVLIGEASHGTHEFYVARADMTRRLIEQSGFCAVAVEADWPDAYRVNRCQQRPSPAARPAARRCPALKADAA
jgi:erythromycin esterase-like protein